MGWYPDLVSDALEAFNKGLNVTFETAQLELGMTPDKLIVRDLNPIDDLGRTVSATLANTANWNLLATAASTVTNWVNVEIADTRFILIHGIAVGGATGILAGANDDANRLQTIEVTRGGKLLRVWHVAHLTHQAPASSQRIWYADDPFTVPQNITIRIEPVMIAAGTMDLILIGRVVEPNGRKINKVL